MSLTQLPRYCSQLMPHTATPTLRTSVLFTADASHCHTHTANLGADDLTPTLIYVLIKAVPEYLASNLAFIERYRGAARLVSEDMYYFVQMVTLPVRGCMHECMMLDVRKRRACKRVRTRG
eukprot:352672-Chlamydomonas_euryale.AAC.6